MLEVLISNRVQGDAGLKKRGDILVAKLAGSPWGSDEIAMVVQWEDSALEQKLQGMVDETNEYPFIIHPYAEYELAPRPLRDPHGLFKDKETRMPVMVNRSKIYVDIDGLHTDVKDRIDRKAVHSGEPVPFEYVTTHLREKETKGLPAQEEVLVPELVTTEHVSPVVIEEPVAEEPISDTPVEDGNNT